MKVPELLAPAGDTERLIAALRFGADAVYLSYQDFGMRTAPQNFSYEQLWQARNLCSQFGAKLFLTCNTLPRNEEIDRLPEYFQQIAQIGPDALIIADVGVFELAKQFAPQIPRHISTQAGIVNYAAAQRWYDEGAQRVILARELTLEEIAGIRAKTSPQLELEMFVHGAMCVSFSGRCLISSYMTGRDSNRGDCAQPCRWSYHLMEEKRPGEFFPVEERDGGTYLLNSRDLSMIGHLDDVIKAGVSSVKIEGRAKSAYYTSAITGTYRMALDLLKEDPQKYREEIPYLEDEVSKVSHRCYTTGFFYGTPREGQYYQGSGYLRSCEVVAVAEDYEEGCLVVTERNRFSVGETLELLSPKEKSRPVEITALLGEDKTPIQTVNRPMMRCYLPGLPPAAPGSILRRCRP